MRGIGNYCKSKFNVQCDCGFMKKKIYRQIVPTIPVIAGTKFHLRSERIMRVVNKCQRNCCCVTISNQSQNYEIKVVKCQVSV